MKKITLFLACLALLATSCSKMESNEKKFAGEMLSEDYEKSTQAFDDFCHWLQNDKKTMTHDFKYMQEKLGMKVCTSPDSILRSYSWVTGGSGTETIYANVFQWMVGDNLIAYCGPLDQLLAGRKADLKKHSSFAHSIDTIFEITSGKRPVYIIAQSYVDDSGMRRAYVSAASINGIQLALLPNLFDGLEIAGNNLFKDKGNTPIGQLFKWDQESRRFYAYQVDDDNNLIPGKYTVYELGEHQFTRLPDEPENKN
jgi:hypothetical protein